MNTDSKNYFVMLLAIKRVHNLDQSLGFVEAVDGWMKQWTIANNYRPMVTEDVEFALSTWLQDFEKTARQILGSYIPQHMKFVEQFEFEYTKSEVVLNKSFYLRDYAQTIKCSAIPLPVEVNETSIVVVRENMTNWKTSDEAEEGWNSGDYCAVISEKLRGETISIRSLPFLRKKGINRIIIGTLAGRHLYSIDF